MQKENNSGMKKISFSTSIHAPKNKVWDILWYDETYRKWTSVFMEGSCAASDWNEGSKIHFTDGKGGGMYSIIEKKVPCEFMSFRHIGEVKGGIEQPVDDTRGWNGSTENYTLKESNGVTEIEVDMDVVAEMLDYFNKTFPVALENVKRLAESKIQLTVETTVQAVVEKVWDYWNQPEHITQWCSATPEWHTPRAQNDLRVGGSFSTRMEAKDGSMGFDFGGVYDDVKANSLIAYTMGDGRKVLIVFSSNGNTTTVTETFEAENMNPLAMQKAGWQNILDNFKAYVENN
ncbi:MAG: SRPBCC domain-containing protein [Ferruginibacter sp.]